MPAQVQQPLRLGAIKKCKRSTAVSCQADLAISLAPVADKLLRPVRSDRQEHQDEMQDESDPTRFLKPFTSAGLQAGPVSGKAGDLIVFDTALFHCGCPALAPFGGKLLRAVCIMSMVPVSISLSSLDNCLPTRLVIR